MLSGKPIPVQQKNKTKKINLKLRTNKQLGRIKTQPVCCKVCTEKLILQNEIKRLLLNMDWQYIWLQNEFKFAKNIALICVDCEQIKALCRNVKGYEMQTAISGTSYEQDKKYLRLLIVLILQLWLGSRRHTYFLM